VLRARKKVGHFRTAEKGTEGGANIPQGHDQNAGERNARVYGSERGKGSNSRTFKYRNGQAKI